MRYGARFDQLFDRGRDAVQSGTHYRDTPPVEGGRWGISVVFRPDSGSSKVLAELTAEAMAIAGPEHWPTGVEAAVHFTVRALQTHRAVVPVDDPFVSRCAEALHHAAGESRPVRLGLDGLTLTPSGIMACAFPADAAADEFAARLERALGEDGWFEAEYDRDIWYATLVHFAGPLADPPALVDWVATRRHLRLGEARIREADLLRFRYNGRQPVRVPLAVAELRGAVVDPDTGQLISDHPRSRSSSGVESKG